MSIAMVAKDLTEKYKEAIYYAASKEGYAEDEVAKVVSSFLLRKSCERTEFTTSALDILGHIRTMHSFVLKHRKDYLDEQRCTEEERDNIEKEVGLFVKACRKHIDDLKDSIGKKERTGWVPTKPNVDLVAHQHGIVLILSEHLHALTTIFDRLRAIRFQRAIEKRFPKRRHFVESADVSHLNFAVPSNETNGQDLKVQLGSEARQDLLDDETQALQAELTDLLNSSEETERKMIEMSALNHLFSTHVSQQAQQIEVLYQQAVEATQNVTEGNKELRKTIAHNSSSRIWALMFLFMMPAALLFLDWYKG